MAWQKGQSGNIKGRPPLDTAESMAACIRKCFSREKREVAILGIVAIATDPAIDPRVRVQAFDALTRHGWPEEKSGAVGLRISGKGAQVLVQHIHQPIGISGQHTLPDAGVDQPANGGVKLGTARHIIESAPVDSPAETPAGSEPPDPLPPVPTDRARSRARTQ